MMNGTVYADRWQLREPGEFSHFVGRALARHRLTAGSKDPEPENTLVLAKPNGRVVVILRDAGGPVGFYWCTGGYPSPITDEREQAELLATVDKLRAR